MTLLGYITIIRERWKVVLTATTLGLAIGVGFVLVTPPSYTCSIALYVSAQVSESTNSAYQGSLLSQQRVKSYTELVDSPRVASEVISQLNLNLTPSQLTSDISASNVPDSVIINVDVSNTDPIEAAKIANSTGEVFTKFVNDLERPQLPNTASPVVVRVVQPAVIPTRASSIGLTTGATVGVLLGALLGAGLAVLIQTLDRSVRTLERLNHHSGAHNLGIVEADDLFKERLVVGADCEQSARLESFRQIRTSLQFVDVDKVSQVLLVTSPLAGEGKTTTASNLAAVLAATGLRVLLVEADLRRPAAAGLLHLERSVGLTTALVGRVDVGRAIQQHAPGGFDFLSAGPLPPNPSELLSSHQMHELITQLRGHYDKVILDGPPVLPVADSAILATQADGVVVIARYKSTRIAQLEGAVEAVRQVSGRILGTVFTMVPKSGPHSYAKYNSYYDSRGRPDAGSFPNADMEPAVTTRIDGRRRPVPYPRS